MNVHERSEKLIRRLLQQGDNEDAELVKELNSALKDMTEMSRKTFETMMEMIASQNKDYQYRNHLLGLVEKAIDSARSAISEVGNTSRISVLYATIFGFLGWTHPFWLPAVVRSIESLWSLVF